MKTLALVLTLATCIVSVCAPPMATAAPTELRVGVVTSLSGNWAALSDMTVKGLELARDDLQSDGSLKIDLNIQDSHEAASGTGAVTAYQSLRRSGISLFIGPAGTPGGLALAPMASKEPVIMISPSVAIEAFHVAGKNIFNSQGAFEVSSRLLARKAFESGARKAAIFASQQPYESVQGDAFEKEFKKLGGEVVARVDPLPESTDLRGEALRIAKAGPDAVFFAVYNQLTMAARELKQAGYRGPKYAPLMDGSRLENAQGGLEGLVYAKLGETRKAFVERFHTKFGRNPDYPADFAHDALLALGTAAKESKSADAGALAAALPKVDFEGASGRFRFDGEGCVIRNPTLWRVVGEKFEALSY